MKKKLIQKVFSFLKKNNLEIKTEVQVFKHSMSRKG